MIIKFSASIIVAAIFSTQVSANTVSDANEINRSVNDSIVEAGDMVQILLPAAGYFAAWMHDDLEGAKQLTYSTLSTQLIIHGVKSTVGRKRPNDSSWNSFPSGHTGAAFSGAAFLQSRYGSTWGIPAYAAATFVGVSRIHGNRHYAGDVVAGASIGFLMNQYFVSPYNTDGVYFNAQSTSDGVALGVTITNDALEGNTKTRKSNQFVTTDLRHRIELGIGTNLADSSASAGAADFLDDSDTIDKYQPFSYVNYQYRLESDDYFELEFLPSETRRRGTVTQPFTNDGVAYDKGDEVYTAFRHWMLGSNIYKGIKVTDNFIVDFGLGLYVHMVALDVDNATGGGKYSKTEYWKAMPSGTVKGQYYLTKSVSVIGKAQYHGWESDSYVYGEAGVNYQINSAWDVGIKYGYSQTDLDNTKFKASYESNNMMLTFSNRF
ncbi:phosphatase PAP2 family protein [Photobacterium profundum]|uniref:undecaprenyl-diphosphate phosphatase n=1 Tax=Photobacterium profundum (strain SS9) TaxID=298386 RepID=Q6LFX0_PHOPR|nr:phosphatase PAP2 family protein [Photobacterium profundum]CAG23810.1 putative PAP2 family protein [Photobacterium profundum SS9]